MVTLLLLCLLTASATLSASDSVSGKLTIQGKAIELKHIYAQQFPDSSDKSKRNVLVVITDQPVPEDARNDTGEMMDLYFAGKFHGVKLEYPPDGSSVSVVVMSNLLEGSFSWSRAGSDVAPKVLTGTRIEHSFDIPERTTGDTAIALQATFAAGIVPHIPEPEPTPADTAAAQKAPQTNAYIALVKANRAGDKAGIMAAVDPERRAMVDTPDFPKILEMVQEMTPKNTKVLEVTESADKYILIVQASNEEGNPMRGKITMVKGPESEWFASRESWGE
jgi:hypothetical protein